MISLLHIYYYTYIKTWWESNKPPISEDNETEFWNNIDTSCSYINQCYIEERADILEGLCSSVDQESSTIISAFQRCTISKISLALLKRLICTYNCIPEIPQCMIILQQSISLKANILSTYALNKIIQFR